MLTAQDCLELGIGDQIVPEPEGGAHTNPREAAAIMQMAVAQQLAELTRLSTNKLLKRRYQKFRRMGEQTAYSQEAMDLEVELLINITADGERSGRLVRSPVSESSEEVSGDVSMEDGPTVASAPQELNGAGGNSNGHAPNEKPISGVSSGDDS